MRLLVDLPPTAFEDFRRQRHAAVHISTRMSTAIIIGREDAFTISNGVTITATKMVNDDLVITPMDATM